MADPMTPDDLVEALRDVPEARLRILDLAREVFDERGHLDQEQALGRAWEIEEALREAHAYGDATERVLWGLRELAR